MEINISKSASLPEFLPLACGLEFRWPGDNVMTVASGRINAGPLAIGADSIHPKNKADPRPYPQQTGPQIFTSKAGYV